MTSITNALGVGSGIDTQALITSLVASQRAPKEQALAARETKNTARISALGTISGSIDAFSTSLNALIAGGTLFTQPTSSDATIASVSAVAGTRLGDLSAELEVKSLAQPQTLVSATLAGQTAPVGQGTLTLTTAYGTADIAIGAGTDSLAALAKAITASNIGVTASVITGSTGAQLVVKGTTGAANSFTLALKDGDPAALGRFAYPASADGGLTQTKPARDAVVALDGVETTRATNSFDDLIPGVKIDLAKAADGTIVKLGANRPTDTIQSALGDFVDAYNTLQTQLADATAAGDGGSGGALRGDRGVAEARRQLAKLSSTALTGAAQGPRTLAEIGISTNRDGTLKLNQATLAAQLKAWPDAVEGMFNPTQTSDSPFLTITSKFGAAKPGTYTVTNVTAKSGTTPASGTIAGKAASTGGNGVRLVADLTSPAAGLAILPSADVASATITIEPGLGGALQAVRDALRGTAGALTLDTSAFSNETKAIAASRAEIAARATTYQDQLTNAFARMDGKVAVYKATQSYLTQQIALWTRDS